MKKQPPKQASLRLTKSELELLFAEMRNSLDCGAEDPDFKRLHDKTLAALQKLQNEEAKAVQRT